MTTPTPADAWHALLTWVCADRPAPQAAQPTNRPKKQTRKNR